VIGAWKYNLMKQNLENEISPQLVDKSSTFMGGSLNNNNNNNNNNNSVALVREGTIPTERPPLVGEVRANVC
jgi:hypothetical protein